MLVDTAFEGRPTFTIWSVSGFYDLIQEKKEKLQFEFGVYWEFHRLPEIQANQLSLSRTDLRARFMAWLGSRTILRAVAKDCTVLVQKSRHLLFTGLHRVWSPFFATL